MNKLRLFALLLGLLTLTGCASRLLSANTETVIGDLRLRSPIAWSIGGAGREHYLTIDGLRLNSIAIVQNVRDGEHVLLLARGPRKTEGAIFRSSMSEAEVAELIAEALQSAGLVDVQQDGLQPAEFAGAPGFRFQLRYATPRGLRYEGLVLAEIADGTLSYLLYDAPQEYFYARDIAAVEQLFADLRRK